MATSPENYEWDLDQIDSFDCDKSSVAFSSVKRTSFDEETAVSGLTADTSQDEKSSYGAHSKYHYPKEAYSQHRVVSGMTDDAAPDDTSVYNLKSQYDRDVESSVYNLKSQYDRDVESFAKNKASKMLAEAELNGSTGGAALNKLTTQKKMTMNTMTPAQAAAAYSKKTGKNTSNPSTNPLKKKIDKKFKIADKEGTTIVSAPVADIIMDETTSNEASVYDMKSKLDRDRETDALRRATEMLMNVELDYSTGGIHLNNDKPVKKITMTSMTPAQAAAAYSKKTGKSTSNPNANPLKKKIDRKFKIADKEVDLNDEASVFSAPTIMVNNETACDENTIDDFKCKLDRDREAYARARASKMLMKADLNETADGMALKKAIPQKTMVVNAMTPAQAAAAYSKKTGKNTSNPNANPLKKRIEKKSTNKAEKTGPSFFGRMKASGSKAKVAADATTGQTERGASSSMKSHNERESRSARGMKSTIHHPTGVREELMAPYPLIKLNSMC